MERENSYAKVNVFVFANIGSILYGSILFANIGSYLLISARSA